MKFNYECCLYRITAVCYLRVSLLLPTKHSLFSDNKRENVLIFTQIKSVNTFDCYTDAGLRHGSQDLIVLAWPFREHMRQASLHFAC